VSPSGGPAHKPHFWRTHISSYYCALKPKAPNTFGAKLYSRKKFKKIKKKYPIDLWKLMYGIRHITNKSFCFFVSLKKKKL